MPNLNDYSKMKNQKWSPHILIRYALLQLPVIAVLVVLLILSYRSQAIPSRLIWILFLVWLAKDVILYPFVWRAYDPQIQERKNPLIGLTGVVQERLDPSGYVKVRGELWQALTTDKEAVVEEGVIVKIRKVNGLTLHVEPNYDQNNW